MVLSINGARWLTIYCGGMLDGSDYNRFNNAWSLRQMVSENPCDREVRVFPFDGTTFKKEIEFCVRFVFSSANYQRCNKPVDMQERENEM